MDEHLEHLIAASAPATIPRTPGLREELDAMVASAEEVVLPSRSRLRRRLALVGGLVVAVLGTGAAASATGVWAPGWLNGDQTLPSGTACRTGYGVNLSIEPAHLQSVSPDVQAGTLAAARRFINRFDISTVSVDEAVARYRAESAAERGAEFRKYRAMSPGQQAAVRAKGGPNDVGPSMSPDELRLTAVGAEISSRMDQELRREGLDPMVVSLATVWRCAAAGSAQ